MTMQEWAANEVKIACEREWANRTKDDEEFSPDWDYGVECYKAALEAFEVLCSQGHSGYSISLTKYILDRLIDRKPLTPLQGTDDEWQLAYPFDSWTKDGRQVTEYQNKRYGALFKYEYSDGEVKYSDVDRAVGISSENDIPFHNGRISRYVNENYPITFPYVPTNKPYKMIVEEFCWEEPTLTGKGYYDTICWKELIDPEGVKIPINKYFMEDKEEIVEISKEQYDARRIECYYAIDMAEINKERKDDN